MLILCQRDPRWANVKIGQSTEKVGSKGCTITAVSMSLSWAGCYKNPGDLAQKLTFTKDGLIIWQSIAEITCMKFLWRGYPSNFKREQIDEALKSQTKTCLLNVDNGNHWVLGIYRVPLTNKYWVADPWTGTKKFYSGVVGYSILGKK